METIGEGMFGAGDDSGCDINIKTSLGDTPLHSAAITENGTAVSLPIKAGLDVNAKGEDRYTPLHEAVEQENIDMVALLLRHGANILEKNDNGDDALAQGRSNPEIYALQAEHARVKGVGNH